MESRWRLMFSTSAVAAALCLVLAAAGEKPPAKPLNLNTASVEELRTLPGIGEVIARRIVRHREKSGKFRTVEELLVIRGISPKKLEALRPYVRVEEPEQESGKKKPPGKE